MGKVFRFRRNTGRQRRQNIGRGQYSQIDFYAGTSSARKFRSSGTAFSARQIVGIILFAIIVGTAIGAWMAYRPKPADPISIAATDTLSAQFGLCDNGGGLNCVIDGDTIRFEGEKIRIVGLDTPETHPPSCAREADLGQKATLRMQELMNEGPFRLEATADRDRDRYGRLLRAVTRNGQSISDTLIAEGLAYAYNGGAKQSWCS
jgi:micrococcal nuclease